MSSRASKDDIHNRRKDESKPFTAEKEMHDHSKMILALVGGDASEEENGRRDSAIDDRSHSKKQEGGANAMRHKEHGNTTNVMNAHKVNGEKVIASPTSANRQGATGPPVNGSSDTTDGKDQKSENDESEQLLTPTRLVQSQPHHRNRSLLRPGAIRVHQTRGGAYLERPDLVPVDDDRGVDEVSTSNQQDSVLPAIAATGGGVVAATLVDTDNAETNPNIAKIEDDAQREGEAEARKQILKDVVIAEIPIDGDDDANNANDERRKRSRRLVMIAAVCGVVIVGAIVGGVVGASSKGSNSSQASFAPFTMQPTDVPTLTPSIFPTPAPSALPSVLPSQEPSSAEDVEVDAYITSVVFNLTDATAFESDSSVATQALQWLTQRDRWITRSTTQRQVKERYILTALYLATNGDDWKNTYSFLMPDVATCAWGENPGPVVVSPPLNCDGDGHVRVIALISNDLSGYLPSEIGGIQSLTRLELAFNELDRTIPSEVGMLSQLELLELTMNRLSGTIPTEIGNLDVLDSLNLADNANLTGPIPTQMKNLTQVGQLQLRGTNITGFETMCTSPSPLHVFFVECIEECSCCSGCA